MVAKSVAALEKENTLVALNKVASPICLFQVCVCVCVGGGGHSVV